MMFDLFRFFIPRASRSGLLIFMTLSLTMTGGCGKKGPVRPKLATLPAAPEAVTLQQQGRLLVLGWAIPKLNQDGTAVEDLTGFKIRRLRYDAADGCPTCRDPEEEVAELELRYPAPAQRIGNRIYWRDFDVLPGTGYRYAITPLTIGGTEGPAATIHLAVLPPPPSPMGLQAEAGNQQVALAWTAPELDVGMELIGYNLYRRPAKGLFSIVPVNAKPLQATALLDRGLDNGRAYEYRVSALVRIGEQLLESMASPAVLITPQ